MTPDDIGDDSRRQGNDDIIASKTKLHKSFLVASGFFGGLSRRAIFEILFNKQNFSVYPIKKICQNLVQIYKIRSILTKPDA